MLVLCVVYLAVTRVQISIEWFRLFIMKQKLFYVILIMSLFILTACSSDDNDNDNSSSINVKSNIEAIDLGLSVKWASINLPGLYQWGVVDNIAKDPYPYSGGSGYTFVDIGSDISGTEYDAAHVIWGNGWRMPTAAEILELVRGCTSENTEQNGVKGKMFIGKNGNKIFLPYDGKIGGPRDYLGNKGYYWSSVPYEPTWGYAFFLKIDDGGVWAYCSYDKANPYDFPHKYYSFSIRPVRDK